MLNAAQRKQLKALANELTAMGQIGKGGLSDTLLSWLDEILEKHELIKLRILRSCPLELNEVIIELCRLLHCDLVMDIGRVVVFYRPGSENKRIRLVK